MADVVRYERSPDERLAWLTSTPYILLHVFVVVGAAWIWPPTWELVAVAVGAYYLRMFAITAGYHRYFAHRGYKTGRVFQFLIALLGTMAAQKGVLWWAGHHRHHHRFSDMEEDIHSPKRGFWWSHHGWFMCPKYDDAPVDSIKDFHKYPELRFLQATWVLWPWVFAGLLYLIGGGAWAFWGGALSTVLLYHGTFTINSLAHVWGSRRYETSDTSRNNFWLSLLTMGEGWHNNHHFYQSTARNGFFWWEVDASYYILKVLSWLGVVWDLRQPPQWVLEGKTRAHGAQPAPVTGFAFPAGLIDMMQALEVMRDEAATRREAGTDFRTRLAERAAEAAERASEVAHKAADAAHDAQAAAADLKARLAASASDAAQRAAALAREAAEAAAEAAAALKTKATIAWAEAAAAAAQRAAEAAERAQAVHLQLAAA